MRMVYCGLGTATVTAKMKGVHNKKPGFNYLVGVSKGSVETSPFLEKLTKKGNEGSSCRFSLINVKYVH